MIGRGHYDAAYDVGEFTIFFWERIMYPEDCVLYFRLYEIFEILYKKHMNHWTLELVWILFCFVILKAVITPTLVETRPSNHTNCMTYLHLLSYIFFFGRSLLSYVGPEHISWIWQNHILHKKKTAESFHSLHQSFYMKIYKKFYANFL